MMQANDTTTDKIIVAIDGGAGTGTSTAAEGVARALGIPHLNTGSMYRALAWEALHQGCDLKDDAACTLIAETAEIEMDAGVAIAINGCDIRDQIYRPGMEAYTPIMAGHAGVRHIMVELQRAIAAEHGAALEGRDIGTHVFPDTPHKFYFVCDPAERVRRVNAGGRQHETIKSLLARDAADEAHTVGAFRKAADAIEIDTTHISAAEVIAAIVEHVVRQRGRAVAQS